LGESSAERLAHLVFVLLGGGSGRDDGAGAVADGDEAFALELTVGDGDGVEVDAEIGGELADGRKGDALAEVAAGDEGFETICQLFVDGLAGLRVDGEEVGVRCMHGANYCMYMAYTFGDVKSGKELEGGEVSMWERDCAG